MKCKKEDIGKLVGLTIWCLNDSNRPMQGKITNVLYDETKNDVIVTIVPAILHKGNSETIRYLRQCYEEFDDLWDHTVNAYDKDLQKFVNKIKDKLKHEVFAGENSVTLNYQLAYILLDYYANKQIRQYYDSEIVSKIKNVISQEMDKAIDKICEDIK